MVFMRFILPVFLCVGSIVGLSAQDFPEQPVPLRIVNDFAGILPDAGRRALERKLVAFNDSTTTQIAVVTVNSLHGYDPDDYAVRLLDLWGIGKKGKDNGILILIKPKIQEEDGQVAISTGYGLEAAVPDAVAMTIINREMIPSFRQNNYYEGIDRAVDVLFHLTHKEFSADEYIRHGQNNGEPDFVIVIAIICIVIILVFLSKGKGRKRGIRNSGFPHWGMGGFGGVNHSPGGGSFGGFGGFGGGKGGGGGASGRW